MFEKIIKFVRRSMKGIASIVMFIIVAVVLLILGVDPMVAVSMLIAGGLAFLAVTTVRVLEDGHELTVRDKNIMSVAVVSAVAVGFITYFAANMGTGALILSLIVLMGFYVGLTIWSWRDVGRWIELGLFFAMGLILFFPTMGVATRLSTTTAVWMRIIILSMAVIWLINLLLYKAKGNPRLRILAIALALVLVIFDIAQAMSISLVKEPEPKTETAKTTAVKEEAEPPAPNFDGLHFFNTDNQSNDDLGDDFDFGPSPVQEILSNKVNSGEITVESLAGKTVADLYAMVTADELWSVFHDRLEKDPALGAATFAWVDFNMGTRFLGKFHSEVGDAWDAAMNSAKEAWMTDKESYDKALEAFFKYTAHAKELKITRVDSGLDDQMYMNPFTIDEGVPDIIVMESKDMGGFFLTFVFNPKGGANDTEVSFRADCGFQPTNVSAMGIPVQSNPLKGKAVTKKSGSSSKSGGGSGSSSKSGGGNTSSKSGGALPVKFPITNLKDPTKGTDVGKNDNPGPGPDTNNGVGAVWSRADTETGTGPSGMNNQQYDRWMDQLEEINKTQRTSTNTPANNPTYKPPKKVDKVDSNAEGTGYGGINDATPTKEVEKTNGQTLKNSTEDTAAGAWYPTPDVTRGAKTTVFESESTLKNSEYGGYDFGGNE